MNLECELSVNKALAIASTLVLSRDGLALGLMAYARMTATEFPAGKHHRTKLRIVDSAYAALLEDFRRDDVFFFPTALLEAACSDCALFRLAVFFARERLPERREPREEDLELDDSSFTLSRFTNLLKLLFWPFAVFSCTISARPFSSNFSNHSSHSISSSEPAPL